MLLIKNQKNRMLGFYPGMQTPDQIPERRHLPLS
jgi:hypothetical protein